MVYQEGRGEFIVGTLQPTSGVGQEWSYFVSIRWTETQGLKSKPSLKPGQFHRQSPIYKGQLSNPMLFGEEVACITPEDGVQFFNTNLYNWTNNPPLLRAARSVVVSLGRNLVVQAKDSIKIFSPEVLAGHKSHNDISSSHIYPLGENHIICILQPTRHITLLELQTMQIPKVAPHPLSHCSQINWPLSLHHLAMGLPQSLTFYWPCRCGSQTLHSPNGQKWLVKVSY